MYSNKCCCFFILCFWIIFIFIKNYPKKDKKKQHYRFKECTEIAHLKFSNKRNHSLWTVTQTKAHSIDDFDWHLWIQYTADRNSVRKLHWIRLRLVFFLVFFIASSGRSQYILIPTQQKLLKYCHLYRTSNQTAVSLIKTNEFRNVIVDDVANNIIRLKFIRRKKSRF